MKPYFTIIGDTLVNYMGNECDIVIPDGVRVIGKGVFASDKTIKNVTLPKSIEVISESAFSNCKYLKEVKNLKAVKTIEKRAFFDCSRLSSVEELKNLVSVGDEAFMFCFSIPSITFSQWSIDFGSRVFAYCSNLRCATLSASYRLRNKGIFENCNKLETLIYTDGICTLYESDALKSVKTVILPETVEQIDEKAFADYTALKQIVLPKNLRRIGERAFSNCVSLRSLTLPRYVRTIGKYAFENCKNLEDILLSDTLETIGSFAFFSCESLEKIFIPASTRIIKRGAFEGCSNLKRVILPDELLKINENVFRRCFYLQNINIPKKLKTIAAKAFENCKNLERIDLPEGLRDINENAFNGCTSLNFSLPSSLLTLKENAFSETAVKKVVLPLSIRTISEGAFSKCKYLKTVVMSENVTTICDRAFEKCVNLSEIILAKDNACVPFDAFNEIGARAFAACKKLSEFVVPEKIGAISTLAFQNCRNLKKIVLHKELQSIGYGAFHYCKSLTDIQLDSENPYFAFVDNKILVKKNSKRLIHMNCDGNRIDGTFELPGVIRDMRGSTFAKTDGITKLIIPKTVKRFSDECYIQFSDIKKIRISDSSECVYCSLYPFGKKQTVLKIPDNVNLITLESFLSTSMFSWFFNLENNSDKFNIVYNNSTAEFTPKIIDEVFSTFVDSPELFSSFGIINQTKEAFKRDLTDIQKMKIVRNILEKQIVSARYIDEFYEIVKDCTDVEINSLFISERNRLKDEIEIERKRKNTMRKKAFERMMDASKIESIEGLRVACYGFISNFDTVDDFAKCVEEHGGIFTETVDENTDMLVTNKKYFESEKICTANALKIPILNEIEFAKLIGTGCKLNEFLFRQMIPPDGILHEIVEVLEGITTICRKAIDVSRIRVLRIPEGVRELQEACICGEANRVLIRLPESLETIDPGAIRVFKPQDQGECKHKRFFLSPSNIIIYAKRGSTAHKFAVEHGYGYTEWIE